MRLALRLRLCAALLSAASYDSSAQGSDGHIVFVPVFQHVWLEDSRAFLAKVELVSRYHLRGYSVWVLGSEDPRVWR